jgi:hypothetical protein
VSKYFDKIRVHDIRISLVQQFIHSPDGSLHPLPRPISVCIRLQGRLLDRFQHQLRSGLHHPVPDRRYPERPLSSSGLGDPYPPHRLWSICPTAQFLSEAVQPLYQPLGLDAREVSPSTPGAP